MNVTIKKLVFGFCILASFQNVLYAMEAGADSLLAGEFYPIPNTENLDDAHAQAEQKKIRLAEAAFFQESTKNKELKNKIAEINSKEADYIYYLKENNTEAATSLLRKKNQDLESQISESNEKLKQEERVKKHNQEVFANFVSKYKPTQKIYNDMEQVRDANTLNGKKMGALRFVRAKEPIATSYIEKIKNFPKYAIDKILGYRLEKYSNAYYQSCAPKYGKGKLEIKVIGDEAIEGMKKDLEFEKELYKEERLKFEEFKKEVDELSERANFPTNIESITVCKGVSCNNTESKHWPDNFKNISKNKYDPENNFKLKNYTIILDKIADPITRKDRLTKSLAKIETGDWPRLKKFAYYKAGATLLGALGGALLFGGAACYRNNQFSKKEALIGVAGATAGGFACCLAANCKKKASKIEEEMNVQTGKMELMKSLEGMQESTNLEPHLENAWEFENPEGDVIVQEIVPISKPSTQFSRKRLVPAQTIIDHCTKIAQARQYPNKRTYFKPAEE